MPWGNVTPNSDWVCDANSIYFNTWQERDDPTLESGWDYGDVEHLEDYVTQYAYAVVIQYNTPPYTIPDRGCAIFLHCSRGATGGCIGLNETDMLDTLLWLDPELNPHILITGYQKG
jgi:L,D-peptidoglycan transpeptidase YkuD (ErfK/YbiS/YcfS/YnhG family)